MGKKKERPDLSHFVSSRGKDIGKEEDVGRGGRKGELEVGGAQHMGMCCMCERKIKEKGEGERERDSERSERTRRQEREIVREEKRPDTENEKGEQRVAVCCSMLQYVAVCYSLLQEDVLSFLVLCISFSVSPSLYLLSRSLYLVSSLLSISRSLYRERERRARPPARAREDTRVGA